VFSVAVPWLRRLVAGVSLWRPEIEPRSVHVKFVVDRMSLGRVITCLGFNLGHAVGGSGKTWGKLLTCINV